MTDQQLLRRAWDALDSFKQAYPENWSEEDEQVLNDLIKADLVADLDPYPDNFIDALRFDTALNNKEWVGLTTEETIDLLPDGEWAIEPTLIFAQRIEAKLKEKNT